jgi:hypothetical protein
MRSRRRRGIRRSDRRIRKKVKKKRLRNLLNNRLLNIKREKIVKRMQKSNHKGRKECV